MRLLSVQHGVVTHGYNRKDTNVKIRRHLTEKGRVLDLRKTAVRNQDLAKLHSIGTLEQIWLAETGIGSPGFKHIAKANSTRQLSVMDCPMVDDRALELISPLTSLILLYLGRTMVSDTGLPTIKDFGSLKWLNLMGCKDVTDKSLELLNGLPSLKVIWAGGSGITEKGLAGFPRLQAIASL